MQAHAAAGAARMHITAGIVVHFQKQFHGMWPRLFGACITVTMILGIAAPTGWSQQAQQKGRRELRSEEHTSELQSHSDLVCRLLLEKKQKIIIHIIYSQ